MEKLGIILVTLFFCSCSRFLVPPKKPVNELTQLKELDENQWQALVLYRLSNNQDVKCDDIKDIIEEKNNAIFFWAVSKYINKCDQSVETIEKYFELRDEFPKWAQKDLYESLYKNSKNIKIKTTSAINYVDHLRTQNEKVAVLLDVQSSLKKVGINSDEIYDKLISVAPRYNKNITSENIYKIARDFEKHREFTSARKLYHRIIKSNASLEDKVQAWNRVRMSYKLERDRETYRKETRKLVLFLEKKLDEPKGKELFAKYATILARIYWTKDVFWRAKKVLRSVLILKDLPEEYKVEAYYHFAGIYEDENKKKKAIHYYEKAFAAINKDHDLREAIIWNLGWYYYKIGKHNKAIAWFDKYESEDSGYRDFRYDFWKAQSLKKIGKIKEGESLLAEIREKDNYGYYGQIAHMERAHLGPIDVDSPDLSLDKDPLSWAIYIKNYELARSIIDTMKDKELAHYYKAKYFDKMIFKYFSFDIETRNQILEEMPIFSYPLAFKEDFLKSNRSNKVSSPLLMAIARQESAFNPVARSPADAFGLLQLIPSQAKKLSRRYNIPYTEYSDLYEPDTNIALSSMLLDELMRRQKKNFIHFIASYNAGETAVRRWKKRMKHYEDLEFIEQIPYKETRKYVKLVARNYLIYKRMLSEKPFELSPSFFRDGVY